MAMASASPSASAAAAHNVFVYGSLLADDVVRVLLNRVPLSSAALLNGLFVFFPPLPSPQFLSSSSPCFFTICLRAVQP